MSAIAPQHLAMLKSVLERDYVGHLAPLIRPSGDAEANARKNVSRAFSAFFVANKCNITPEQAARSVVDDFEDEGLDAIHYQSSTGTLFLVQAKLKEREQFSQEEAFSFKEGIQALINQDFTRFNRHVLDRRVDIEGALDSCSQIQLVIAHVGSGVSLHATSVLTGFLTSESDSERRFVGEPLDYNAEAVVRDLVDANAHDRINTDLWLEKESWVTTPRETYFGLIPLIELVHLHQQHGKGLYKRNIRSFLGQETDVNRAIRGSLLDQPADFLYLNNGITALCDVINPRGTSLEKGGRRKIEVEGLSVINGAQTIASAAALLAENPASVIDTAKVHVTLIKAHAEGEFGNKVTTARNHQNKVERSDFASLEDIHERLRREMLHFGHHYAFKTEANLDRNAIRFDEAAYSLSLFQRDARYPVWAKHDPKQLLIVGTDKYTQLFDPEVRCTTLINAVLLRRYLQEYFTAQSWDAEGIERATYKHGILAAGWVLAKRLTSADDNARPWTAEAIQAVLANTVDELRQQLADICNRHAVGWGPLALFRSQGGTLPVLKELMITNYGLAADPVPAAIIGAEGGWTEEQKASQSPLFNYLITHAPQITMPT